MEITISEKDYQTYEDALIERNRLSQVLQTIDPTDDHFDKIIDEIKLTLKPFDHATDTTA